MECQVMILNIVLHFSSTGRFAALWTFGVQERGELKKERMFGYFGSSKNFDIPAPKRNMCYYGPNTLFDGTWCSSWHFKRHNEKQESRFLPYLVINNTVEISKFNPSSAGHTAPFFCWSNLSFRWLSRTITTSRLINFSLPNYVQL